MIQVNCGYLIKINAFLIYYINATDGIKVTKKTLLLKIVAPNQKNAKLFEGLNKIKKQLYRKVWYN